MSTKRLCVLTLVGLLLLGLLAVAIYLAEGAGRSTIAFPDGTRLKVVGTLPGGRDFSTEKTWRKLARKVLPKQYQSWVPAPLSASGFGGPSLLAVWFTQVDANGAYIMSPRPFAIRGECFIVGKDGLRFPAVRNMWIDVYGGTVGLDCLFWKMFPSQQPEFSLEFQDTNHVVLGTVRVPNPFPKNSWRPEPTNNFYPHSPFTDD